MFENLTVHNAADFRQRYMNTIGFLHQEGAAPLLIRINEVGGRQVNFTDIDGREMQAAAGHQTVRFEFIPVTRGWHNGKQRIWYMYRVPAKQYQRGIARGNTKLLFTKSKGGALQSAEILLENLADFMRCEPSTATCLEQYQNNKRSGVALSRHFALADNLVYFFDKYVGDVSDRKKITLHNSFLRQELSDFIRRNNLNLEMA